MPSHPLFLGDSAPPLPPPDAAAETGGSAKQRFAAVLLHADDEMMRSEVVTKKARLLRRIDRAERSMCVSARMRKALRRRLSRTDRELLDLVH